MAGSRDDMRRRRTQLGHSQESAARAVGVGTSTYGAWERGISECRPGFRPRIARALQVSLTEVDGWFDERPPVPDGMVVPSSLGVFASHEQGAAELWAYEPVVMPGLLQTPAYAAAVECNDAVYGPPSGGKADRWVQWRLARQAVLTREPEPLVLSVVLDESVLLRVAGDGEVMAEQLDHLAEATTRPNVAVRILPLDRGTFVAGWGSFTVLTSPGSPKPYMACVFDRGGTSYLERPHDVDAHMRLFQYLEHLALPVADSLDLIRTVTKERYT